MEGWIKLHRQILEWEWFDDQLTFRLFIYLLLTANVTDKNWHGTLIKRGELVTSYTELTRRLTGKQQARIGVQSIRTSIDRLKSTGELTVKTTNKFSLFKLNNYEKYQGANMPLNTQLTGKQQATNKQLTTIKEGEEGKNDKNIYTQISKKEIILHDGTRAFKKFDRWYSSLNSSAEIDPRFYPEINKL